MKERPNKVALSDAASQPARDTAADLVKKMSRCLEYLARRQFFTREPAERFEPKTKQSRIRRAV